MTLNKIITICILFLCLNSPAFAQNNFSAKVIKIHDGDSFIILKNKTQSEIRLSSIDAPEYFQNYGRECKLVLEKLILGNMIYIKPSNKDKYGRTIAEVFYKNQNINQEMVKQGCAWAYTAYLKDKKMIGLERHAKANKIGLWSQPKEKIIPPWKTRR